MAVARYDARSLGDARSDACPVRRLPTVRRAFLAVRTMRRATSIATTLELLMRIKQSLCYPIYQRDTPLPEFCRAVKAMGYAAIEFWARPDNVLDVIKAARDADLAIASMCGHGTLPDGLNKASNHDRIEAELRDSIDFAAEHGVPGLICFSGNRNENQTDDEGMAVCAKGLQRVAGYAEKRGVNLNVELLNSKVDHPGYQCDRTAWGVALCRMVASPRVKLLYDIYHMQIMEGDVIRTIQESIEHIGHFHTAGNPGRKDMDDTQELNYRGICQAIARTDYDGYVGHEYSPKGDPMASLREAFTICDQG